MSGSEGNVSDFIKTSQKAAQHLTEQQISALAEFQTKITELSQGQNKFALEAISSLASAKSIHELQLKTLDISRKHVVNLMDGVSQIYATAIQNNIVKIEKSKANS